MKKVIFFLVFIIILFAGVAFLSNMQKEKAVEGNMYKKDNPYCIMQKASTKRCQNSIKFLWRSTQVAEEAPLLRV